MLPCYLCFIITYFRTHQRDDLQHRYTLEIRNKRINHMPNQPNPSLFYSFSFFFFHTLAWIHQGCTCDPKHEPPFHLPHHNISLGHPHAPAPSILYPASDIDWRVISYMIVYMFPYYSPKSSHPLPLPQSPKGYSLHLCLFCCLAYRVIITIFLNAIYMC